MRRVCVDDGLLFKNFGPFYSWSLSLKYILFMAKIQLFLFVAMKQLEEFRKF